MTEKCTPVGAVAQGMAIPTILILSTGGIAGSCTAWCMRGLNSLPD